MMNFRNIFGNKGYTLLEATIVLMTLTFIIAILTLTYKGCSYIHEHGVKTTIDRIWEGEKK